MTQPASSAPRLDAATSRRGIRLPLLEPPYRILNRDIRLLESKNKFHSLSEFQNSNRDTLPISRFGVHKSQTVQTQPSRFS